MKKLIMRAYGVAAILFLFLILYGLMNLRLNTWRRDNLTGYCEITDYEVTKENDATAELGKKTIMSFTLSGIRSDFDTLLFMTSHQNVTVYVGSEEVYSMKAKPGVIMPKSPGVVYNEVVFSDRDNGKKIKIVLEPIYAREEKLPDLLLGNGYQLVKVILFSNLPILVLCFCVILIGVMQIIMALINRKQEERLQVALTHSAFTIVVGFWKIIDSDFIALFGKALPVLSLLSFVVMMFLPIMLTKLVRDTLDAYKTTLWCIPEVVSLFGIMLTCIFQFFGVLDFRESIWIAEVGLASAFLCSFAGIGIYVKENGWDKDSKNAIVCAVLGLLWVSVDAYTYFGTKGVTKFPFSIILFLVFLLLMIGHRMKVSRMGMEVGMQARQYKKIAYHDALTGFFNRAAYVDFLASSEFNPQKSILLAFDLNNLKKCNDVLGHEKGDIYIKESAKIIMDCFGERGRCYRLGGDEFGAILMDDDLDGCERRVKKMNERVKRFNQESNDIRMGIACGYAIFDPDEDEDVHATIRRADKMMYEVKFRMKQQAEA